VKKLLIAAWAVAGLLLPSIGRAECVRIPGTTQQIFERYPVVFVADVLGIDAVIDPIPFRYRVRFQVAESFKGADRGERVLDFASSPDDHVFKVGTRLLVYASRSGDRHSTACTPTRAVSNDDREVQELRKLVSGAQRP
jgi:hypothetical protein